MKPAITIFLKIWLIEFGGRNSGFLCVLPVWGGWNFSLSTYCLCSHVRIPSVPPCPPSAAGAGLLLSLAPVSPTQISLYSLFPGLSCSYHAISISIKEVALASQNGVSPGPSGLSPNSQPDIQASPRLGPCLNPGSILPSCKR